MTQICYTVIAKYRASVEIRKIENRFVGSVFRAFFWISRG